jgi:GntR family transcriptional regulator
MTKRQARKLPGSVRGKPSHRRIKADGCSTAPFRPGKAAPELKRRPGIPLYHQVSLVIQDWILSKRYQPGEPIPGEEELAQSFQVSRVTIRTALARLLSSGLVETRHGVGTFVRSPATTMPMHAPMADLLTHLREISRNTSIEVVEFSYSSAPTHIQSIFGKNAEALFQRTVRLRRLKGKPILHLTTYIPEAIARGYDAVAMEAHPLHVLLKRCGIRFSAGDQVVSAALADPLVASRLDVQVGAPLIQIRRTHLGQDLQPVAYLELLASPADFELRMSLDAGDVSA